MLHPDLGDTYMNIYTLINIDDNDDVYFNRLLIIQPFSTQIIKA
jgi:hypothetical protein